MCIIAFWLNTTPRAIAKTVSMFVSHERIIPITRVGSGGIEIGSPIANIAIHDGGKWATVYICAFRCIALPKSITLTETLLETIDAASLRASVLDGTADPIVTLDHGRVLVYIGTATIGWRILAYPRQII